MSAKKVILIAEDAAVNRKVLIKLLSLEYTFIEAENGQEALELLHQNAASISAVILDLVMPVMDGFGFLRAVQGVEEYKNLPIIVATGNGGDESETDALKLGAWDFITKPYNGEIIRFRLRNAIERSQLSAFHQLKYLAEYDTLTGIYNKNKFFEVTREMLDVHPGEQFALLRLDIDRFQLINSFFGIEKGDKLLRFLADTLKAEDTGELYAYGRMEADVFAVCFAYPSKDEVFRCLDEAKDRVKAYNRSFDIVPIFGVYFLDDLSLPVSEMLDRAELAAKTCKGNSLKTVAVYQPELRQKLEKEQEIVNEMAWALEQNQFCIYLQPKYALTTNSPSGAEALVRWIHPKKGMISPGEFIPIFEKNGFISKLDYFVWESVCRLQHQWISEGLTPAPISVNVSRVNFYNPNLVGVIVKLLEKYELPARLIQLELTESAYMDNPQLMEQVVGQLHEAGFTILMDDFGSGYSSLSVLKDVNVDVLKIDMRFFEKTRVSGRGENIVASIVRMAKWLNLPVTAEGVETREQVDFLRSVGCDYVQGFYFARPMTVDAYVHLIQEKKTDEQIPENIGRYAGLNPDRLWSLDPEMLLLFADDPSSKVICEFNGQDLEMLRVNRAYKERFGFGAAVADVSPWNLIMPEYHERVLCACRACVEQRETEPCEYLHVGSNGQLRWVRLSLQYVQRVGTKHILMAHLEDITELKQAQMQYQSMLKKLPSVGEATRRGVFLLPDLLELMIFLKQVFDVARLVDPVNTSLVELTADGEIEYKPYSCFRIWDRETRCENCTSMCSMHQDCRMTKYEYIRNNIFYVVSNPVMVEDRTGCMHRFALELVSHVSDHLLLAQPDGKSIEQLLEETQQKIYTDSLTGAYNRRYLSELLFSHHGQNSVSQKLGLVLLDLRGFKKINDRCGHEVGDRLLVDTACALKQSVRQSDSVIRYGGDEFVVALTGCSEDQMKTAVERMRQAVNTVRYGDENAVLNADFGCAYTDNFEASNDVVQEMLRTADAAMYKEKNAVKIRNLENESRLTSTTDV